MKKKWFEGSGIIECDFHRLEHVIENHGKFFESVVGLMPGISSVELLDQGRDYLVIKTNEGLMQRSNIKKSITPDGAIIEFDEEYKAGKMITASSHFIDEFTSTENGIIHRCKIGDLKVTGILGFFYNGFGSGRIGKAVLSSHKT